MTDQEKILFGRDNEQNIVGAHIDDVLSEVNGYCTIKYYTREGEVLLEKEGELSPFFFLSDMGLLSTFPEELYNFYELEGDNYYKFLVYFDDWFVMWKAVGKIKQRCFDMGITDSPKDYPPQIYIIKTPEEQWLTQTGKTFFKGMQFNDVHRFRWDIETYSSRDGFPNPERWDDRIIIITVADNRGFEETLFLDECGVDPADIPNGRTFETEAELLQYFVRLVRDLDPDTMEGHNVYAFDFWYVMTRCRLLGVEFAIGRDGTVPDTYEASKRFAERDVSYTHVKINGRSVIDTYFDTMAYDVFSRDLPGYGLKVVAKHFGFMAEDREYVAGDKISWHWDNDPMPLLKYAQDDTTECTALSNHLGGATFFMSTMIPMTYQKVGLAGMSSKIESLFVRQYLRQLTSLPRREKARQEVGGYTDLFQTGVYNNIVYADVASLYPSIMLNYNVQPEGDILKLFPQLLGMLKDLRFETKAKMNEYEKGTTEHQAFHAMQTTYKNIINSFYGMLGFGGSLFNDYSEADRVTVIGQDLLRTIIKLIRGDGGDVVEVDTDGVLAQAPEFVYTKDDEEDKARAEKYCAEWRKAWGDTPPHDQPVDDVTYVKSLTDRMPKGIVIDFDGRAVRMISYKKKNYALREPGKDKIKVKGGSLISRLYEEFGRRFCREVLEALMDRDVRRIAELYRAYYAMITDRTWDVADFAKKATLKDAIETYIKKVQRGPGSGGRNRDAAYELAIRRFEDTGLRPEPGDRIRYFVSGNEKKSNVRAYRDAQFAEAWNPEATIEIDGEEQPDWRYIENTNWYRDKRLKQFADKFQKFFTPDDFKVVFGTSPIDDIDFDAIEVQNKKVERRPVAVVISGPANMTDIFWIKRAFAGAQFLKTLDKDDHGMDVGALVIPPILGFTPTAVQWAKYNNIPYYLTETTENLGPMTNRVRAKEVFELAGNLEMDVAAIVIDHPDVSSSLNLEIARLAEAERDIKLHMSTTV